MSGKVAASAARAQAPGQAAHVDVLIVGAGISGVGAAWHLKHQRPEKSFVVLEAKETFGGTWVTHTYPGVRSDSDLYTFGYRFKPWVGPPIASAGEILTYMGEVIADGGLDAHIRYGHRIESAAWSTADKAWTVRARTSDGVEHVFTASFLWMCQGYYRHDAGYLPDWPGLETYEGRLIHAQVWPDDLDLSGKRVLVIGSGATAATVVPAIAGACANVTLLQRSPTYFVAGRNDNELANLLRKLQIDETWIHEIVRRKVLFDQAEMMRRCREEPETATAQLLAGVAAMLPPGYDVATHFTPNYRPWRQRIAFVPNGDLFQGIASGRAGVVTGHIERFTPKGVLLQSGETLEADVVIAATGFNLCVDGDIALSVDGRLVKLSDTVTYRGMMFTGLPNFLWVFGYFRASWTLRVDLLGDFVCRLLAHMDARGKKEVQVKLSPQEEASPRLPWMEEDDFNPGYLARGAHLLPKRLAKREWSHTQDYWREKDEIPAIDLDDPAFAYS
jgi:cation diffusion facilitator CzcD-associated flavoprotein CzcO